MMREDLIDAYLFEIETPGGSVTEKRLLRTPPAQGRLDFLGYDPRHEPEDLLRVVAPGKVERLSHLIFFQDDQGFLDVIFCHRRLISLKPLKSIGSRCFAAPRPRHGFRPLC